MRSFLFCVFSCLSQTQLDSDVNLILSHDCWSVLAVCPLTCLPPAFPAQIWRPLALTLQPVWLETRRNHVWCCWFFSRAPERQVPRSCCESHLSHRRTTHSWSQSACCSILVFSLIGLSVLPSSCHFLIYWLPPRTERSCSAHPVTPSTTRFKTSNDIRDISYQDQT